MQQGISRVEDWLSFKHINGSESRATALERVDERVGFDEFCATGVHE